MRFIVLAIILDFSVLNVTGQTVTVVAHMSDGAECKLEMLNSYTESDNLLEIIEQACGASNE